MQGLLDYQKILLILCDKNQFRTSLEAPEYSLEIANEVFEFHQTIPNYKPTPFVELDNLAKKLKVARNSYKVAENSQSNWNLQLKTNRFILKEK